MDACRRNPLFLPACLVWLGILAFAPLCAAQAGRPWGARAVHPWMTKDAQALLADPPGEPLEAIRLAAPRNDWLTAAALVRSDEARKITVELDCAGDLQGRVELRVVGLIRDVRSGRRVWSPLLEPENIRAVAEAGGSLADAGSRIHNIEQIADFPVVTVTPEMPLFLWLTVDLRGIDSGAYEGMLRLRDEDGQTREVPLFVDVLDAELPEESPLKFIAWQWCKGEKMFRELWEHGVNVVWSTATDAELAWQLSGGKAEFVFQFGPTWGHEPVTEELREASAKHLQELTERMNRLGVPREQWSVQPFDEPSDSTAELLAAYGRMLEEIDPEVRIFNNPAYIIDPVTGEQSTTTQRTFELIESTTDILCPYSWFFTDPRFQDLLDDYDAEMWAYDIYGAVGNLPESGVNWFRTAPWFAWRHGLAGVGNYCLNDFRAGGANYAFMFVGRATTRRGTLVSTRAFEAVRQGVQEYKRLHALAASGAGSQALTGWVDRALGNRAENLPPAGPAEFDVLRREMDELLVKLQSRK